MVIEDVITTGGSALKACAAIEEAGGTVLAVLACVDRQEGGREAIEEAGYQVLSLYGVDDLLSRLPDGDRTGVTSC